MHRAGNGWSAAKPGEGYGALRRKFCSLSLWLWFGRDGLTESVGLVCAYASKLGFSGSTTPRTVPAGAGAFAEGRRFCLTPLPSAPSALSTSFICSEMVVISALISKTCVCRCAMFVDLTGESAPSSCSGSSDGGSSSTIFSSSTATTT